MQPITKLTPALQLLIEPSKGYKCISFELGAYCLPRFSRKKLNNLQTLGLFCKMSEKRNPGIYTIAVYIFHQKGTREIRTADLFLKEMVTFPFIKLFTELLDVNKKPIDPMAYAIFSFPTEVYIDYSIPWEVWMLLYFSRTRFRDQLLLEVK